MRNKKNVIMIVMLVAIALMSMGYALFATQLNINSIGNITSTWNIYFASISAGTPVGGASNVTTPSVSGTSANMNVNLELPGDSMTYSLVLRNGGTIGAIIEDIDAKAEGSTGIIYSISGLNIGDKLAAGASKTITIKVEYDPNTTSQPSETSKKLTVTIDAVQDIGQSITTGTPSIDQPMLLSTKILKDNIAYADNISSTYVSSSTGINFAQAYSTSNGNGLYHTNINTEDNKTTYYFRGEVYNNYVSFGKTNGGYCTYNGNKLYDYYTHAPIVSESVCSYNKIVCDATNSSNPDYAGKYYGAQAIEQCQYAMEGTPLDGTSKWEEAIVDMLWRIVRINEDGSIRLLLNNSAETDVKFNVNGGIGGEEIDDNAYVGYMYGEVGSLNYADTHANLTNSTIKSKLDSWYNTALTEDEKTYVYDSGFCNDRTLYSGLGYGANYTVYAAHHRISILHKPQFACPNESRDLFTLTGSAKGNKTLINPIGLLTADEAIYAGLNYSGEDYSSYRIYLNNSHPFWTMTPHGTRDGDGSDYIYLVNNNGAGGSTGLYSFPSGVALAITSHTMRPVINLKATVEITNGNGTIDSPYIIKID